MSEASQGTIVQPAAVLGQADPGDLRDVVKAVQRLRIHNMNMLQVGQAREESQTLFAVYHLATVLVFAVVKHALWDLKHTRGCSEGFAGLSKVADHVQRKALEHQGQHVQCEFRVSDCKHRAAVSPASRCWSRWAQRRDLLWAPCHGIRSPVCVSGEGRQLRSWCLAASGHWSTQWWSCDDGCMAAVRVMYCRSQRPAHCKHGNSQSRRVRWEK